MNLLLLQSSPYLPTYGGAPIANRVLLEGLAARGHRCAAVVPATAPNGPRDAAELEAALAERGVASPAVVDGVARYEHRGVGVHAVFDAASLTAVARRVSAELEPTWVLLASEDFGQVLLDCALELRPSRVVYIAQTTLSLPFGPESYAPSRQAAERLRRVAGVITISRYLRDYLARWGELDAEVLAFPLYGEPPFPEVDAFDDGFVTLINPCAFKGITIFRRLAAALPAVPFAAVPTWGTNREDRTSLERLANVTLLDPVDRIDDLLRRVSVLLVPSIWGEAFGYVVVEAMLRGIPVVASHAGGLPEAKLGVDYVLPVRPISSFEDRLDDQRLPVPRIPEQDLEPWITTLERLTQDRDHHRQLGDASRQAALAFVESAGIDPFERFLSGLEPAHIVEARPAASPTAPAERQLSPRLRALLAAQLRRRQQQGQATSGGGDDE